MSLTVDFYTYVVNVASLAAGGSGNASFNVDADADFKLQKLTYMAAVAGAQQQGATREVPLVTVDVKMSGSGRSLTSSPVPIPALFGTGEIPFILPTAKILAKNATVSIALANFSAATAYSLYLVFIGTKLFQA